MRCFALVLGFTLMSTPALAQRGVALPVPADGEWDFLAITPDESTVYIGDYASRLLAVDTADQNITVLDLPDDEFLGGVAVAPDGRLFVTHDYAVFEIDPATGLAPQTAIPPSWYGGPMVFTADSQRMYVAGGDDIYVLDTDPLAFVDTTPGDGEINGLYALNPMWSAWHRAWRLELSPDGDTLFFVGDQTENDLHALQKITGLTTDLATLTYEVVEIPNPTGSTVEPRILLAEDGSYLDDSYGTRWNTADLTVENTIQLSQWASFTPSTIARSPNGFLWLQGFATTTDGGTHRGESLLAINPGTLDLVDLDDNTPNGVTGVPLPGPGGEFDRVGAYNVHAMIATDNQVYVAGGTDVAVFVDLNAAPATRGRVVPNRGGDGGDVSLSVTGQYVPGTQIRLELGADTLTPSRTEVLPGGALDATFDLRGVTRGAYDVVLTPPGGTPERLTEAFTVEETRENAIVDVVGADRFHAIDEALVRVFVKNTGNVDLTDPIVSLDISEGTRYAVNLPALVPGGPAQNDDEKTTAEADTPERIWLARLRPGQSYAFTVVIEGPANGRPQDWDISVRATVGYVQTPGEEDGALIGELCTVGDAFAQALINESKRRELEVNRADVKDTTARVLRDTAVEYGVSKTKEIAAKTITALVVAGLFPAALPLVPVIFGALNDMKSCYDFATKLKTLAALFSLDPNDKAGTTGIDGYITGNETMRYRIRFENQPDATAAARIVTITDTIDPNLRLDTLEVTGSSHATLLDVGVDETTRVVTFTFDDIDLPPNATPPEGEGWIDYEIELAPDLADGTQIDNAASIVFDINEPIVTPTVVHTVDKAAPVTTVAELGPSPETITLTWAGDDAGVGVWDYDVFVSKDGGPFESVAERIDATQIDYTGQVGATYGFYVVARDYLGNAERRSEAAVTTTVVSNEEEEGGCGCNHTAGASTAWWALLALVVLRRRR
ncbi:MAG: MYXO-CTERM sorting domain-containing protein [Deltaproteobacteria bacterium]